MRVLVLGISGMLGNAVFKILSQDSRLNIYGTLRSSKDLRYFDTSNHSNIITNVDVLDNDRLISTFEEIRPNVVVNCIGLIKQLSVANDPLLALPINSMLPHRLNRLCGLANSRLIHISTDCVFSGHKGKYTESDMSDAEDLYGKSKYIGEIHDSSHCVTLRTSIIGHELNSSHALIDWFLSQTGSVKGFRKAIFSGLPTVEMGRVIKEFVLPNSELAGLYHVSADPIDKYTLLKLVAKTYGQDVEIIPDDNVCIDRSLISSKFKDATNYVPPTWPELINFMYSQKDNYGDLNVQR